MTTICFILFFKIRGVAQRPAQSHKAAAVYHYCELEVELWCHYHFLESHQLSSLLKNLDSLYYYQISARQHHQAQRA